jgi:hypothetical protein
MVVFRYRVLLNIGWSLGSHRGSYQTRGNVSSYSEILKLHERIIFFTLP